VKSIQEQLEEQADRVEDLLVDPRLASEREAQPLALRHALRAFAHLSVSASLFEAQAEGQIPDGAHASTGDDPVPSGLVEGAVRAVVTPVRVVRLGAPAAGVAWDLGREPSGVVIDNATARRFHEAMSAPPAPLDELEVQALNFLCSHGSFGVPQWVGDRDWTVSRLGLEGLVRRGFAARMGVQSILTAAGLAHARERDRAPRPVAIDGSAKAALRQLWNGKPVDDGDVVSKVGRETLLKAGLAVRVEGLTSITEMGRRFGREIGWPEPADQERAREDLVKSGRAHDAQVKGGPRPACSRCGRELMFSSRQRGDGLCGVCSRAASGTSTPADAVHLAMDDAQGLPRPEAPAVAPLDFPLTADEERARLAAVTGPCDGATFLLLGRSLACRIGQPLTNATTRAVAAIREALDLAQERLARGATA